MPLSPRVVGCARASRRLIFWKTRSCSCLQALEAMITKCRGVTPGLARQMKEATMTTKLVALVLLCLMTGTAMAQQAKVTSLMSKDLTENPGKEVLMITVEYPPGASDPIHRHNAQAFVYRTGRLHCDAVEGWRTGNADTWTDLLRRTRRCSCRWPERKQHQAGEISGALDQEQWGSSARASRVTVR